MICSISDFFFPLILMRTNSARPCCVYKNVLPQFLPFSDTQYTSLTKKKKKRRTQFAVSAIGVHFSQARLDFTFRCLTVDRRTNNCCENQPNLRAKPSAKHGSSRVARIVSPSSQTVTPGRVTRHSQTRHHAYVSRMT